MITDTGLILMGFMTTISMIILIQLNNRNWFKKFKFKNDIAFLKKQQDLQLRKLAKNLNVDQKTGVNSGNTDTLSGLSKFLPLLKNLDGEQLEGLINGLTGEEGGEGGAIESILGNIPPELIEKFLSGLNKAKDETADQNSNIVFES